MELSVFQVAGPVMIGPSSSHTAGAAKLARIAAYIAGGTIVEASFGLYGSFAKTYRGHGTDRALVAGALGMREDDERLPNSFALAEEMGLAYDFHEIALDNAHENTVEMRFIRKDGSSCTVTGASIGGGEIQITNVDGFETKLSARSPTLVIWQYDRKGVLSDVSRLLADRDINIGVLRLSRHEKGGKAFCVVAVDNPISADLVEDLKELPNVIDVRAVDPSGAVAGEEGL